jgi:3-keto-5-aminohexanoate cleavage enzyme
MPETIPQHIKENKTEKTIITAAVTGGLTTKQQNPNLPHTPEEIARAAIDSWNEGASIVHLHARDPLTGKPLHQAKLFKEIIQIIRGECDLIINTTTGVGPGATMEERIAIIPELSGDPKVKPEMASLNCGSLNFGMLNRKKREFILNDVQMNPWASLLHFADTMKQCGVTPELEVYDAGMINNALVLESLEALETPLHFQFVLGVLGGMQATIDNLVFLKNSIPKDATWSVCAIGLSVYTIGPAAIGAGGNVRVGFEDCVYITKGILADSNAQMVAKMKHLSEEMGREVATPEEARKILGLKRQAH